MRKIITAEESFGIPTDSFSVSPSNESYTLEYSVDGVEFTSWSAATPANEVLMVCGCPKNTIFRLKNNESEVKINY